MEKCSTAYRNRMYRRQKGTKSTSEYNKIAAKISLKGGVREIWGVHLGKICC